ncbi:MAG: hypothetical protein KDD11_20535, partial [Acidobacteria bacterium]|nr:hypothetical protein [Acidobacteriota bacterium]
MSRIPSFAHVPLMDEAAPAAPRRKIAEGAAGAPTWRTPEGLDLRPIYSAADLEGVDHLGGMPGMAPYV